MSGFRVKIGEQTVEVDGLDGLITLAREGRLGPEDPVYLPASGRWHYARSIRQLRELFPGLPDPPPPRAPAAEPETAGADVVPLRKPRWSPEGRGVEVPVFGYDVDLFRPARSPATRIAFLLAAGAMAIAAIVVYRGVYRRYLDRTLPTPERDRLAVVERTPEPGRAARAPVPTDESGPATAAVAAAPDAPPAAAPGGGEPSPGSGEASPRPDATPLPFDAEAARAKVLALPLGRVERPDQLGDEIKGDLIRLGVPVRAAEIRAERGDVTDLVPFRARVDYVAGEGISTATLDRQRWMVVVMVGRRFVAHDLRVATFRVASWVDEKKVSEVVVPVELARRAAEGAAVAGEVTALFHGAAASTPSGR